jgi:hypothetical protein
MEHFTGLDRNHATGEAWYCSHCEDTYDVDDGSTPTIEGTV